MIVSLLAQAAVAAAPPAAEAAPAEGVISYPPSYFAGQQVANAFEMLSRIPGYSLDTGSSVRGYEGAAGNALIDGRRPTSKTDSLDEILRRVPASAIERIDVIRGGAPGIDMQGKTVIANVIRKSGASFQGLFAIAENHLWDGRDMHGMRLELSGGDGSRAWEASARYGYGNDDGGTDGPQLRIAPDGRIIRRSIVRREADGLQQVLTGAYSQPLLGGQVRVNGRAFWDSWKDEESNRYVEGDVSGTATSLAAYDDFQTELGLRYDRDLGPRTRLEVVGLRTDRDYHAFALFAFQGATSELRRERDQSETILRGVLKHQQSSTLSLEAGAEGALNKLGAAADNFQNGAPAPLPAGNVQVEEKRGEAFAKATWRPAASWTVDGSVRFEASRISSDGDLVLEKTLTFLKPRLAVSWEATPLTQFRVRLEREVGQLNFDDFVSTANFNLGQGVSAGNPDLNPQQAWVAEAAWEQRFWRTAAITLTYRHSELTDAIDRGPVFLPRLDGQGLPVLDGAGRPVFDVFDQPTNIGDGSKDELIAKLTMPLDHVGLDGVLLVGSLNKRWSKVTDPTTGESRRISSERPLEWEFHVTHDVPRYALSYGVDVFGGWTETVYRYNFISERKLQNSFVRLFVEKRLDPATTLRAELGNVFSRGIRFNTKFYDGTRATGPLKFTDDRDLTPGPNIYLRVRRTFGS